MKRNKLLSVCWAVALGAHTVSHANQTWDNEALKQVRANLFPKFSQCGSSLYTTPMGHSVIYEVKDLRVVIHFSEPLTDIDQLNGYHWRGVIWIRAARSRAFGDGTGSDKLSTGEGSWGDWTEGLRSFLPGGEDISDYLRLWVEEKKGTWTGTDYLSDYEPVDCAKVPSD